MNLEKCFVTFSTNDNYLKLSEIMIESVSKFSKYPIILYYIVLILMNLILNINFQMFFIKK